MVFVLLGFLVIILFGIILLAILVRNKKEFGQLIKMNIIKIVVIFHLVYVSIIFVFNYMDEVIKGEFSYTSIGCIFIILFSIVILIFNKKLSNNKILIIITIIIYILVLFFVPVLSIEGHSHEIERSEGEVLSWFNERIVEYTVYENCYSVDMYTVYK